MVIKKILGLLGGSRGMLPQKSLKRQCSTGLAEIAFTDSLISLSNKISI